MQQPINMVHISLTTYVLLLLRLSGKQQQYDGFVSTRTEEECNKVLAAFTRILKRRITSLSLGIKQSSSSFWFLGKVKLLGPQLSILNESWKKTPEI